MEETKRSKVRTIAMIAALLSIGITSISCGDDASKNKNSLQKTQVQESTKQPTLDFFRIEEYLISAGYRKGNIDDAPLLMGSRELYSLDNVYLSAHDMRVILLVVLPSREKWGSNWENWEGTGIGVKILDPNKPWPKVPRGATGYANKDYLHLYSLIGKLGKDGPVNSLIEEVTNKEINRENFDSLQKDGDDNCSPRFCILGNYGVNGFGIVTRKPQAPR